MQSSSAVGGSSLPVRPSFRRANTNHARRPDCQVPRLRWDEPKSAAARASNKALLRCGAVSCAVRVAAARGPRDETVASALPAAAAAALIRAVWLPPDGASSDSDDDELSVDESDADESTTTQGRLRGDAAAANGRLRTGTAGGGAALAAGPRPGVTVAAAASAGSAAALGLRKWRRRCVRIAARRAVPRLAGVTQSCGMSSEAAVNLFSSSTTLVSESCERARGRHARCPANTTQPVRLDTVPGGDLRGCSQRLDRVEIITQHQVNRRCGDITARRRVKTQHVHGQGHGGWPRGRVLTARVAAAMRAPRG